jgi:hypothetical protein
LLGLTVVVLIVHDVTELVGQRHVEVLDASLVLARLANVLAAGNLLGGTAPVVAEAPAIDLGTAIRSPAKEVSIPLQQTSGMPERSTEDALDNGNENVRADGAVEWGWGLARVLRRCVRWESAAGEGEEAGQGRELGEGEHGNC